VSHMTPAQRSTSLPSPFSADIPSFKVDGKNVSTTRPSQKYGIAEWSRSQEKRVGKDGARRVAENIPSSVRSENSVLWQRRAARPSGKSLPITEPTSSGST